MDLKRTDLILKCIVEEFIKTASPVGSVTLLKNYDLKCSSATIRNAMARLEKEGLIEKTHVSSGRVPSAKGYQYYLDHLNNDSTKDSIDMEFQREFKRAMQGRTQTVEEVLSRSCQMLSELTNTATVVLGPKAEEERLVSIQLLKLNDDQAIGIFVTDSGYVEKKTFVLKNSGVSFESASSAVEILNARLAGSRISELQEKALAIMPIIVNQAGRSGELLIQAFIDAMSALARKRYVVYGKKNLLSLPEFSQDSDAFMSAIDALEDPSRLQKDMYRQDDLGVVSVGFTSENNGDLAVISKQMGKDKIAVVGPKRMDYKKVLSALEYIAFMLDKFMKGQTDSNALIPISPPTDETVPIKTVRKTKKRGKKK